MRVRPPRDHTLLACWVAGWALAAPAVGAEAPAPRDAGGVRKDLESPFYRAIGAENDACIKHYSDFRKQRSSVPWANAEASAKTYWQRELLAMWYKSILLRPACFADFLSGTTLNDWLNVLTAGEHPAEVLAQILESPEFLRGTNGSDEALLARFLSRIHVSAESAGLQAKGLELLRNAGRSARASVVRTKVFEGDEFRELLVAQWIKDYFEVGGELAWIRKRPEVQEWAHLLRQSQVPVDVQGSILGSTGFYAHSGGRPDTYVRALYRVVLGRPPTEVELSQTLGDLQRGAGRATVATELLLTEEGMKHDLRRWAGHVSSDSDVVTDDSLEAEARRVIDGNAATQVVADMLLARLPEEMDDGAFVDEVVKRSLWRRGESWERQWLLKELKETRAQMRRQALRQLMQFPELRSESLLGLRSLENILASLTGDIGIGVPSPTF